MGDFDTGRFLEVLGGGFKEMQARTDQRLQVAAQRAFQMELERNRQKHDLTLQDRYDARQERDSSSRREEAKSEREWREEQNRLDREITLQQIAATRASTEEQRAIQRQNAYNNSAARLEKAYDERIAELSDPEELQMLKITSKSAGVDPNTGERTPTPYTQRMDQITILKNEKRARSEALRLDYGEGSDEELALWEKATDGGGDALDRYIRYTEMSKQQRSIASGPEDSLQPGGQEMAPAEGSPPPAAPGPAAQDSAGQMAGQTEQQGQPSQKADTKKAPNPEPSMIDTAGIDETTSKVMGERGTGLGRKRVSEANEALTRIRQAMYGSGKPSVRDAKAVLEAYSDEDLKSVGLSEAVVARMARVETEQFPQGMQEAMESGMAKAEAGEEESKRMEVARLEKMVAEYQRMKKSLSTAQSMAMAEGIKKQFQKAGLDPPDLG